MRPQKRYGEENHFFGGGKNHDRRAHRIVDRAIKAGLLDPKPCEICGSDKMMSDGRRDTQAHHDDYMKPLAVRWLCTVHHREWHSKNTAVGA